MMGGRLILAARVAFAFALGAVAWFSLLPPDDLPDSFGLSDKLLHVIGYALLGVLAVMSGLRWPVAWLVVVGWGLLLESAQGMLGYRSFEWWDLVADALGAGAAVIVTSRILVEVRSRREALQRERKRARRKERRAKAQSSEKSRNPARAAARRGAPTWQQVSAKQGSKCWLCGTRTYADDRERTSKGTERWGATYPEVDYVVSIESGGTYEDSNLRLAHRHCAATRRAKPHLTTFGRPPRTYT